MAWSAKDDEAVRRLVSSAFARLTVPNSCWSCHTVRPLASAVSHAVRRSRCILWTTPDAIFGSSCFLKARQFQNRGTPRSLTS